MVKTLWKKQRRHLLLPRNKTAPLLLCLRLFVITYKEPYFFTQDQKSFLFFISTLIFRLSIHLCAPERQALRDFYVLCQQVTKKIEFMMLADDDLTDGSSFNKQSLKTEIHILQMLKCGSCLYHFPHTQIAQAMTKSNMYQTW